MWRPRVAVGMAVVLALTIGASAAPVSAIGAAAGGGRGGTAAGAAQGSVAASPAAAARFSGGTVGVETRVGSLVSDAYSSPEVRVSSSGSGSAKAVSGSAGSAGTTGATGAGIACPLVRAAGTIPACWPVCEVWGNVGPLASGQMAVRGVIEHAGTATELTTPEGTVGLTGSVDEPSGTAATVVGSWSIAEGRLTVGVVRVIPVERSCPPCPVATGGAEPVCYPLPCAPKRCVLPEG